MYIQHHHSVSSDGNRQVQLEFLPKAITGKWIFCFFFFFFVSKVLKTKLYDAVPYNFSVKCLPLYSL